MSADCARTSSRVPGLSGTPATVQVPPWGTTSPDRTEMSVDLPEPDGPNTTVRLPRSARMLTRCRTGRSGS